MWLLIGLIVVVASLIPVFGPYIGAVPAVVAAFFITWFLKETPLRETAHLTVDDVGVEAAEGETVGGAAVVLAEVAEKDRASA